MSRQNMLGLIVEALLRLSDGELADVVKLVRKYLRRHARDGRGHWL